MGEFPSKMEHTEKKVEVLKSPNKVLIWFWGMSPAKWPCWRKAGQAPRGLIESQNGWKSLSFLSAWKKKKQTHTGEFKGFCFEEAWKKSNFGKKMFFGVPEDLYVSRIKNRISTRLGIGKGK